jgi:hypothetical protein
MLNPFTHINAHSGIHKHTDLFFVAIHVESYNSKIKIFSLYMMK